VQTKSQKTAQKEEVPQLPLHFLDLWNDICPNGPVGLCELLPHSESLAIFFSLGNGHKCDRSEVLLYSLPNFIEGILVMSSLRYLGAADMALPHLSFKPRIVGKCCQGLTAMTRSPANDGTTSLRAAHAGDAEAVDAGLENG
jgi:hypothetical protein